MKTRQIPEQHIKRIKAIGEKVRTLRKALNVSYEDFALRNGIHRVTYFNLEKGKNFNISTLLKVLDAHRITLEEFFKALK